MIDPVTQETLERTRRIETRITKIGRALGLDVGGGRPMWVDGKVVIPTPNCSIGDILKAVPEGSRSQDIDVHVHGEYLFTLFVDE